MKRAKDYLSEEESKIMDLLIQAGNEFKNLKETLPNQRALFLIKIQECLDILNLRILQKILPEDYPQYNVLNEEDIANEILQQLEGM